MEYNLRKRKHNNNLVTWILRTENNSLIRGRNLICDLNSLIIIYILIYNDKNSNCINVRYSSM